MRWAPVARPPPPPRVQLQEETHGRQRRRRQQVRSGRVSEGAATGDAFPAAPLAGLVVVLVGVLCRLGQERAPPAAVVFAAADAVGARGEPPPPHVQDKIYGGRQGRRRRGRAEAAGTGGRAPAPDPCLVVVLVLGGLLQEPSRGGGGGAVAPAARALSPVPARGGGGEPARERVRARGVPRAGALREHAGVGGRRAATAEGHGAVLLGQRARGSGDQRLRLRAPVHAVVAGQGEEGRQGEGRRRWPQEQQAGEAGHGAHERSTGLGSGHAGNNASDSPCLEFFFSCFFFSFDRCNIAPVFRMRTKKFQRNFTNSLINMQCQITSIRLKWSDVYFSLCRRDTTRHKVFKFPRPWKYDEVARLLSCPGGCCSAARKRRKWAGTDALNLNKTDDVFCI
jgi:hypothetical protein